MKGNTNAQPKPVYWVQTFSGVSYSNGITTPKVFTASESGTYLIIGNIETDPSSISAGAMVAGLGLNNNNNGWLQTGSGSGDYRTNVSTIYPLNAGDKVYFNLYSSIGGTSTLHGSLKVIKLF